jgi:SAM-dependent methyltransferase
MPAVPTSEDLFFTAHSGLPREAPGSAATTRLLLTLAGPLPPRPRVVDIGCGPGTSTLLLAELTGGDVLGVDTHAPFLDELRRRGGTGLQASMEDLPLADGSADLLWAEGSAYVMGVDAALAAWRRLLAPGGVLVLTEAEWTTPDPAPGARAFWDDAYPAMRTTAGNVAAAQAAGWTVAATYLLPESDWDAYYGPLAERLAALRAEHPGSAADLDAIGHEITVRAEHGADYGYTAYVLRPR